MEKLPSGDKEVPLAEVNLRETCDFRHAYHTYLNDYDGGKMDGFNLEGGSGKCGKTKALGPYQYVNPTQISRIGRWLSSTC